MKKFALFVFAAIFISTSVYANHHEGMRDEGGFYDEYNKGYGERSTYHRKRDRFMDDDGDQVHMQFKLRKGEPSKKRKYTKRQIHEQKMRYMMKRLNKLPPEKRDAALKEIERHRQEMRNIIGDNKNFPEFQGKELNGAANPPPPTPAPTPSSNTIATPPPPPPAAEAPKVTQPKPVAKKMTAPPPPSLPAVAKPDTAASDSGDDEEDAESQSSSDSMGQKSESRNINVKWRYPKALT